MCHKVLNTKWEHVVMTCLPKHKHKHENKEWHLCQTVFVYSLLCTFQYVSLALTITRLGIRRLITWIHPAFFASLCSKNGIHRCVRPWRAYANTLYCFITSCDVMEIVETFTNYTFCKSIIWLWTFFLQNTDLRHAPLLLHVPGIIPD